MAQWFRRPPACISRGSVFYPGVPDLCFVLPDKTVAFMEIKREGGRLNEAQQAFQARCALLGLKYSYLHR